MGFEPLVIPVLAWGFSIGILGLLIYLIIRIQQSDLTPERKLIKQVLNGLLVTTLLFFVLNPIWYSEKNSEPVLVISADSTQEDLTFWKSELGVQNSTPFEKYSSNSDSVILLGADFPKEFLYALRAKSVEWIIPTSKSQINFLDFKGILRQGETQRIQGDLPFEAGSELSIFQAETLLENFTFDSAQSSFDLKMTASVIGRNEWQIKLNGGTLGGIRFFVLPKEPLRYHIQAGFPNPEIRTLSRFLLGKGAQVQEEIQLSKNASLGTEKLPLDSVDVFVIDPSQVADQKIQAQWERGASLLVLNLNDPPTEAKVINQNFSTDFSPSPKTSNEIQILENGLEALPFNSSQRLLAQNAVAVEQIGNSKIGVSLVTSSFQLLQSGDSIGYEKFWSGVLGDLRPAGKTNWRVSGPIFQNQFFKVEFNGADSLLSTDDQNQWSQSLINPNSKKKEFLKDKSGWHQIADGIEVYVSDSLDWSGVLAQRERSDFLKSQVWLTSNSATQGKYKSIPFWIWWLLFTMLLIGLWLEPKIGS